MKNTNIMVEMMIKFNNDFDVKVIENLTGIEPTSCSTVHDSDLSSFWVIKTDYIETLLAEEVLDLLLDKIENELEIMAEIVKNNNGKVTFEIVPIIEKDNVPSIFFNRRFLHIAEKLDAVIDIDMYVNST